MELNQNLTDCIHLVNHIGSTTYVNICNNTEHVVSWGGMEWLLFVVVGGAVTILFTVFFAILIKMGIEIISDY